MILHNLKIAWRNLNRNRLFTLINMISLAIGLSASFVIGVLVYYDFSFDKFHEDHHQIYRIISKQTYADGTHFISGVPSLAGASVREDISGIELTSSFFTMGLDKVEKPNSDSDFTPTREVIYADGDYFRLFNYNWLSGSKNDVLQNPNELVLTKARATYYFPELTPDQIIGKILIYDDTIQMKITGIVSDLEQRTDLTFQEFISIPTAKQTDAKDLVFNDNWGNTNSASQVFIKISASEKNIQNQLNALAIAHEAPESEAYGEKREFLLQPLSELHFSENLGIFNYSPPAASKDTLIYLGYIALFLLILGCVNFVNLTTAAANKRSKEIGVKKTLGSSKPQLIQQFLSESIILTFLAGALSLVLSYGLLKVFSDFLPEDLSFQLFYSPVVIGLIIILLLFTALVAGIYPSLILSRLKPVSIMNGGRSAGKGNANLRKGLIVFQFTIAQVFIIATLFVGKQINYMMAEDMGINTETTAYVYTPWKVRSQSKREIFRQNVTDIPAVTQTSLGNNPPASFSTNTTVATFRNGESEQHTTLQLLFGDRNFLDLYEIEILAGRVPVHDSIREYVINETYLKELGFDNPIDVIDKTILVDEELRTIVGVMKDFNQKSLKSPIKPMAFIGDIYPNYSMFRTLHFTLDKKSTDHWPEAIAQVETAWKMTYPEANFRINFMDDVVEKFYRDEKKTSTLLNWATGFCILISCLGLLGLVIYTTERRSKEISIRKVLGATVMQLNFLLCKEFMLLVALAFLLAAPLAWWWVKDWLQNFAFKTGINWGLFVLGGIIILAFSLFIIGIRTTITARRNPVKSLISE